VVIFVALKHTNNGPVRVLHRLCPDVHGYTGSRLGMQIAFGLAGVRAFDRLPQRDIPSHRLHKGSDRIAKEIVQYNAVPPPRSEGSR
jgi:hypothetical protein